MKKLLAGFKRFRGALTEEDLRAQAKLSEGQTPEHLFIACSDSRVMPSLFTQSAPGTLFEIQTAGNLVPAYGTDAGYGIAATIEYAVSVLKVSHVVVCGHSHCGAMGALFDRDALVDLPDVANWLRHAETARRMALCGCGGDNHTPASPELVQAAVEANVVAQLGNLRTHPSVATGLATGALEIHGWVYQIESADVRVYDAAAGRFESWEKVGVADNTDESTPVPASLTTAA
jgi:carbonic anhydrase